MVVLDSLSTHRQPPVSGHPTAFTVPLAACHRRGGNREDPLWWMSLGDGDFGHGIATDHPCAITSDP
jgi:hypothetical protein